MLEMQNYDVIVGLLSTRTLMQLQRNFHSERKKYKKQTSTYTWRNKRWWWR